MSIDGFLWRQGMSTTIGKIPPPFCSSSTLNLNHNAEYVTSLSIISTWLHFWDQKEGEALVSEGWQKSHSQGTARSYPETIGDVKCFFVVVAILFFHQRCHSRKTQFLKSCGAKWFLVPPGREGWVAKFSALLQSWQKPLQIKKKVLVRSKMNWRGASRHSHASIGTYFHSLWYISFLKVAFWLWSAERAKVTACEDVGAGRAKGSYNGGEMWATTFECQGDVLNWQGERRCHFKGAGNKFSVQMVAVNFVGSSWFYSQI